MADKWPLHKGLNFLSNRIINFNDPYNGEVANEIRQYCFFISLLCLCCNDYFEVLLLNHDLFFFENVAKSITSLLSISFKDSSALSCISVLTSSSSISVKVSIRSMRMRRSIRLSFFSANSIFSTIVIRDPYLFSFMLLVEDVYN